MNIETTNVNHSEKKQKANVHSNQSSSVKFVDELQKVAETEELEVNKELHVDETSEKIKTFEEQEQKDIALSDKGFSNDVKENSLYLEDTENSVNIITGKKLNKANCNEQSIDLFEEQAIEPLDIVQKENLNVDNALKDLNTVVKKLTQSDEKIQKPLKSEFDKVDTKEKGEILINNDLNITENKEILPQMSPNMNFSGDGQPFSDFVAKDKNKSKVNQLGSSAEDLAEEAAILSSMAENIAIANKNNIANSDKKVNENIKKPVQVKRNIFDQNSQPPQETQDESVKTVTIDNVVKKVDTRTNITVENVVKLDSVVMNEADAEFFVELVQKGEVNLKNLAPEAARKSIQVSKTLADMLAKSMENNQPLRIDFDNNISVIIRISRDGKISADFLPSSQVAEAYLRDNLPILRQKFEDSNIKYDELNQRERREQREQSRKKGRDNE